MVHNVLVIPLPAGHSVWNILSTIDSHTFNINIIKREDMYVMRLSYDIWEF